MKPRKPDIIFARVEEGVKARVQAASEVLRLDPSDLLREAISEKLARLSAENKAVARAIKAITQRA